MKDLLHARAYVRMAIAKYFDDHLADRQIPPGIAEMVTNLKQDVIELTGLMKAITLKDDLDIDDSPIPKEEMN